VVCDRYMLSTLAYQSAQGLDLEWLKGLHQGILQPELTFLLDIDPELSMQRLRSEDKFEKIEFQKKVRDKYLELSKQYPNTYVIQTGGTRMQTHQEMLDVLQEKLASLKD
jgi:dTMP kinase